MGQPQAGRPLLSLDGVTVRVRQRLLLPDAHWRILEGQQWAVLDPNASGKTILQAGEQAHGEQMRYVVRRQELYGALAPKGARAGLR
jgi:ABC-type molybdenum transport system ATPase subunit/photorepair protein PhrA